MLFETSVETKRLLLRAETPADSDAIYSMNTDPDVMRDIGDGSILSLSRDELSVHLGRLIAKRLKAEYGLAAVILKKNNQYIGACWLKDDDFCGGIELGFRYRKEVWGSGYATEAARTVLEAGFQQPQLDKVFAYAHPKNQASIRVIQKLGFKHIEDKYHLQTKTKVPIYQMKQQDFCTL